MYEKDEFPSIEAQLADEAQQLLDTRPLKLVVADLRHELSVRQENRRQAGALLAIAVVVGVGAITLNSFSNSSGTQQQESYETAQTDSELDETVQLIDITDDEEAAVELHQIDGREFVFVYSRIAEDGQSESAIGIYVPEQLKDVDGEDLTAAQRYAVSELLGSEVEFHNDRSI